MVEEHERSKLIIELLQRVTKNETCVDAVESKLSDLIKSDDEFKNRYYKFEIDVLRKLDAIENKLSSVTSTSTRTTTTISPSVCVPGVAQAKYNKTKSALIITAITTIGLIIVEIIQHLPYF